MRFREAADEFTARLLWPETGAEGYLGEESQELRRAAREILERWRAEGLNP